MRQLLVFSFTIACLHLLTACNSPTLSEYSQSPQSSPQETPLMTAGEEAVDSPNSPEPSPLEETDESAEATPSAALIEDLKSVVAVESGVSSEAVQVVEAEAVDWPDACLGVSNPDQLCAQVITPGYRIVLSADNQEYVFHTDRSGDQLQQVEE